MAYQMSYTLDNGLVAPNSYWTLGMVGINPIDKTGMILFYGYATQADFTAGKPPVGKKEYNISPSNYDASLAALNLDETVYAPAYALAKQVADSPSVDAQGNPTLVSFFANATSV